MPAFRKHQTYWEFVYQAPKDRYSFRARANSAARFVVSFVNDRQDWACAFAKRVR